MVATLTKILGPNGKPYSRWEPGVAQVRASFDAASPAHPDNQRHWLNADDLSPNSAASAEVRKTLRKRARYECKNNSYCRGMVSTLANDTVGRGPRLQLRRESPTENRVIEAAWTGWTRAVKLAAKLRRVRQTKAVDGESLAITVDNPRLSPVTLDVRLLECDYLASPWNYLGDNEYHVDGVELDDLGEPLKYWILDHHPGDEYVLGLPSEGKWYPPSRVFHSVYSDRAGQVHGIPEITPALDLYAILRRYTLATLGSAESAADIAGILKSNAPPDTSPQSVDPFLPIEFERRALLTMPMGWDMQQLRAEQPTTMYADFKREVINEIARCLHMPFNVAAGNSSDYNYASGRLDHQLYFRVIEIERHQMEVELLDRLFHMWLGEYLSVTRGVRAREVRLEDWPRQWVWDGFRHADPAKEATAVETLWNLGLLTDDQYLLREGIDPEEHYAQQESQNNRRRELRLPLPGVAQQLIEVDQDGKPAAKPEAKPEAKPKR